MNAFVLTIDKEEDSDLSSKEGSNSIQAGIALLQEASPMLAEYISMAHKAGNLTMLDLREVWLLDSQTTYNLCCNPNMVAKIKKAQKMLNMSGNGGKMKITQEAKVPGLYPEGMKPAQTWFDVRYVTSLLSFKELVKVF